MNVWEEFFETILYINLDHRKDRNLEILESFYIADIPYFKRISGIPNTPGNISDGFNQAQRNALETCKGNSLVLEDDVIFSDISHLEAALNELPDDWDMLYLGANVVGTDLCSWPEPEYYSEHLRSVSQAWTTHAIAYSQKGRNWILANWDHKSGQMYDDFLRCSLEKLQAFIIYPMVADQRKGYSDIWQRPVDYGFFNKWRQ